ncbi:MAG TPA: c-type cytochrome, partial [Vicinamibacterales bacterium]|nr:c-type cytochrome [Vicinamibacterales bacterium]
MSRRLQVALVIAGAIWMAAIAVSSAQQVAPGEKKVWDGVYTAAQAARGKPRFEASCSRCHNIALAGSERGPALKGSAFWSKWENESLGSLYTVIRDTMPRDGGASVVSDEIKTDILAYILSVSGMPVGNDELKVDLRALDGIKIAKKTVWDGVFTAGQADRGKENYLSGRCGGCHKLDLTGDRGPALKGEDFIAHWENGSVVTLFDKIRETMPQNSPNDVTEDAKADIVAYLLQVNGFPAGKTELRADAESLGIVDIVRKGRSNTIANFSLVQVVGCLTQGSNNAWTLTSTSDPVLTRDEEPNAAALKT